MTDGVELTLRRHRWFVVLVGALSIEPGKELVRHVRIRLTVELGQHEARLAG